MMRVEEGILNKKVFRDKKDIIRTDWLVFTDDVTVFTNDIDTANKGMRNSRSNKSNWATNII